MMAMLQIKVKFEEHRPDDKSERGKAPSSFIHTCSLLVIFNIFLYSKKILSAGMFEQKK